MTMIKFLLSFCLFLSFFSHEKRYDVTKYGILPSDNKDDSRMLQLLINKIATTSNVELFFPAGVYDFTNTVEVNIPNLKLLFEDNAVIKLRTSNNGAFWVKRDGFEVHNATFIGNRTWSNDVYKGYGILLAGVNNAIIKDSSFKNISGCAIFLIRSGNKGCSNNLLTNNRIENGNKKGKIYQASSAILLGLSGDGYSHDNNVIEGNFIDGGREINYGINISAHGNGNIIKNNEVKNFLNYGILSYESDYGKYKLTRTHILNNKVSYIGAKTGTTNSMGMGIYLMQSHFSVVKNNIINNVLLNSDNSETLSRGAIALGGAVNCIIENNSISASGRYGIYSSYGFGNKFINNKIEHVEKDGIFLLNSSNNVISKNYMNYIKRDFIRGAFGNMQNFIYAQRNFLDEYRVFASGRNITISENELVGETSRIYMEGGMPGQKNKIRINNLEGIEISNNSFKGQKSSVAIMLRNENGKRNTISNNLFK